MVRSNNKVNPKPILPSLSPKDAITLLNKQNDKGKEILERVPFQYPEYNGWQNTTREFLIKAFGSDSGNVKRFISDGRIGSVPYDDPGPDYWRQRYTNCLTGELQILNSAIEQLEAQAQIESPGLEKDSSDALAAIENVCVKFHRVARQLKKRHGDSQNLEIKNEYDVQDLIHSLLWLFFDNIVPEEATPGYAGKSSRIDFLLKAESIGLEVKMTRNGLSGKEIGTQLIEDIARYRKHPECKTLVCFVYDPEELISNPKGLEDDLSREDNGMLVKVIVAPKY